MRCPKCDQPLAITQRQGVEIDKCPSCRGVWLDRGELDKIINRYDAFDEDDERRDRAAYREHHHPRRISFWQELFD
jgi:Zn-finger nucleic acid-binding protein